MATNREGARSSCGTLTLSPQRQSDDAEASDSETPKRSTDRQNITQKRDFYQQRRPKLSSKCDCSSQEGALARRDEAFWVNSLPNSITWRSWRKSVGRQTTGTVRRMRERRKKKKCLPNFSKVGSSWTSYNFGQGLVCWSSPQLCHLNLGPVLLGCCPLLISLRLWPQCLLALSANYQPKIYFVRGLGSPRRTWTNSAGVCVCVQEDC